MTDLVEFLWGFSLVSLFLHFLRVIKGIMAVTLRSGVTGTATSSSSSSAAASSSFLSIGLQSKLLGWSKYFRSFAEAKRKPCATGSPVSTLRGGELVLVAFSGGKTEEISCSESNPEENEISRFGLRGLVGEAVKPSARQECSGVSVVEESSSCEGPGEKKEAGEVVNKVSGRMRKRPARIIIPENNTDRVFEAGAEAGNNIDSCDQRDFEVQGGEYCLASRRGRKRVMEDGYGVITNISGDSKQAFFGVYDGHGGRAAVDHVVDKLGNNILRALEEEQPNGNKEQTIRRAVREGYLTTDKEFLAQGVSSGACAATVLIKDGELVVSNVGDCRVVLSRKRVAHALTSDHRPDREDERVRIENSGGYVNNQNGVWRVHGTLAISRAIGDSHMKDWIISEPEVSTVGLDSDCEFLIVASDGLWDKVGNQEAVDVVLRHKYSVESCKKLVDMACSRGNKDDTTVMVVPLQHFT
ncbi:hypothetical protein H6P81_015739 [Aristolochia fimbriata]|uniref:protein-serine/threonine phosphatase n=1 Tax=Aristolochia fimbriata TaxID=158543 RepID=A0AAV7E865_ARIFI|nr:hypothetical protein H6P81_015739 [Aristolochia fimbriata]